MCGQRTDVRALILALTLYAYGCAGGASSLHENVDRSPFGLQSTTRFSMQVQEAVAWSNALLSARVHMRLEPRWDVEASRVVLPGGPPRGPAPRVRFEHSDQRRDVAARYDAATETCIFTSADPIGVFLVDDDALSDYESLFVPEGSRVIIVSARALPRLWRRLSTNSTFGGSEREPTRIHAALIVVLLLHEIGHLFFDDAGSYQAATRVSSSEFLLPSNRISNKEVRADRFAVEQLLQAEPRASNPCIESFYGYSLDGVARDVRLGVRAASSTFDVRQDPFGVFDGVPKPFLFQKGSYSHPDLDLRFMTMDALLFPEYGSLERLLTLGVVQKPH
jgi:hypothetical protein